MRNERHRSSKIHAELSRRSFVLALLDHRIPTYQSFFFPFFFYLPLKDSLSLSLFFLFNDIATGGSILSRFVAVHLRIEISVRRLYFEGKEECNSVTIPLPVGTVR